MTVIEKWPAHDYLCNEASSDHWGLRMRRSVGAYWHLAVGVKYVKTPPGVSVVLYSESCWRTQQKMNPYLLFPRPEAM